MCDLMYPVAKVTSLLEKVNLIISLSPEGCTIGEIAAQLNKSKFAIRPRISELMSANKVRDSGIRRMVNGASSSVLVAVKQESS